MDDLFLQSNKTFVQSISDETGDDDHGIHLWNLVGHVGIVDEVTQSFICSDKHLQNNNDD